MLEIIKDIRITVKVQYMERISEVIREVLFVCDILWKSKKMICNFKKLQNILTCNTLCDIIV